MMVFGFVLWTAGMILTPAVVFPTLFSAYRNKHVVDSAAATLLVLVWAGFVVLWAYFLLNDPAWSTSF